MINWQIDHERRLVTASGAATVTMQEIRQYLREIEEAGGMPYAKCVDARFSALELSAADLRSLGEVVTLYTAKGKLGPIAIVVDADAAEYAAELFDQRTAAAGNRPLGIFRSIEDARQWLRSRSASVDK